MRVSTLGWMGSGTPAAHETSWQASEPLTLDARCGLPLLVTDDGPTPVRRGADTCLLDTLVFFA